MQFGWSIIISLNQLNSSRDVQLTWWVTQRCPFLVVGILKQSLRRVYSWCLLWCKTQGRNIINILINKYPSPPVFPKNKRLLTLPSLRWYGPWRSVWPCSLSLAALYGCCSSFPLKGEFAVVVVVFFASLFRQRMRPHLAASPSGPVHQNSAEGHGGSRQQQEHVLQ